MATANATDQAARQRALVEELAQARAAAAEAAARERATAIELATAQAATAAGPAATAELVERAAEAERLRDHVAALQLELAWMQGSATWRWRERLLRWPILVRLYRRLKGIEDPPGPG